VTSFAGGRGEYRCFETNFRESHMSCVSRQCGRLSLDVRRHGIASAQSMCPSKPRVFARSVGIDPYFAIAGIVTVSKHQQRNYRNGSRISLVTARNFDWTVGSYAAP
jgi:hypothetical protein